MASFITSPRKVRASYTPLPAGPRGMVLGNTVKISAGLTNGGAHTTFGRDVSGTASTRARQGKPTIDALTGEDITFVSVPTPDEVQVDPAMPSTSNRPVKFLTGKSSIGEDATASTSTHWAITSEPVDIVRAAVDAIRDEHFHATGQWLSYSMVRGQYLARIQEIKERDQRKTDKAAKRAASRLKRNHQSIIAA